MKNKLMEAAAALRSARKNKISIGKISEQYGVLSLDDAYAVAQINVQMRIQSGEKVVGKKVGLTSKVVQKQLGVDQPDYGILFADMEYLNGDLVPSSQLIQPKVEAEIAFVVGRDLVTEKPSYSEFLASIDYAIPALEIVDSAIENWQITLADTVADNASCGLYVLGSQPISIGMLQLEKVDMQMTVNEETVSQGKGAACLGHPLRAAYWLACTMAARGEGLKAGEVILSGALGPMVPIQQGDEVKADLAELGTISFKLV